MKRLHGRIVIAALMLFAEAFAVGDMEAPVAFARQDGKTAAASHGERPWKTSLKLPVLTVRQHVSG